MSRFFSGLFVFFCLSNNLVFAQRYGEIGVHAGATYYLGELNWSQHFYTPRLNLGVFYKHHLNSRLALKAGSFYSHIQGDDKDSRWQFQNTRDFRFETLLWETAAQVEFNFLVYKIGNTKKKFYTPYLDLGIGALYYNTNKSSTFIVTFPVALGFKVNLSSRIVLGAEWAFRRSTSDILDNLTGEKLEEYRQINEVAYAGNMNAQRGFFNNNDWYSYAGVTLSYAFVIGGMRCYSFD